MHVKNLKSKISWHCPLKCRLIETHLNVNNCTQNACLKLFKLTENLVHLCIMFLETNLIRTNTTRASSEILWKLFLL
jgi:hypothetical protein